ncbi:hypothetical protein ACB094_12G038800 [Castanea mollissima]
MARGLAFTVGLTVLIVLVLVHPTCCATVLKKLKTCCAMVHHTCSASSRGNIHNISFPFRLKTDPENCGYFSYNLSCENNRTVLYSFGGKFYVEEISYNNYTIRIVDSGIQKNNYFSTPNYSLYRYNFSSQHSLYTTHQRKGTVPERYPDLSRSLVWMSYEKPVNSPLYLDTCNYNNNSSSISDSKRYRYVTVGITNASEVEDSYQVEKMFLTSWPINNDDPANISCTDVHNELVYGFELSWLGGICGSYCGRDTYDCYLDDANHVQCIYFTYIGVLERILDILRGLGYLFGESAHWWDGISSDYPLVVIFHLETKIVLGIPCMVAFLIYKWRKRHLPMYDAIEEFLQSQINLMPIRYSYSEIRKMSKGFKDKLGEGGYGCVYRGKLESGPLVAIKMLGNSKEESIPLSIEKIFEISLGVARGIEYLHRGCDVQILHFDIKPHNILLDENFIPKVSDFGLAKLYPANDSIVYLTAARGTLGYIAPELFYKNNGGVSYKADVYSFGMLLLEMASRRKNMNAFVDHSSQIYFPTWVYGQFSKGNDIEIEDATEEEKKIVKKMIIVALWCIQMKPSDRPSMNKVVEMLEGEVECLQIPSKPFLSSSPARPTGDVGDNLNSTSSSFQLSESSQSAKL